MINPGNGNYVPAPTKRALDQLNGVLRVVVPSVLAYAVGAGWITTEQIPVITQNVLDAAPIVLTFAAAFWSWWRHRKTVQIDKVANMDGVRGVVAVPALANQGPLAENPKVVSTPTQLAP